jgi:hypothetical protein
MLTLSLFARGSVDAAAAAAPRLARTARAISAYGTPPTRLLVPKLLSRRHAHEDGADDPELDSPDAAERVCPGCAPPPRAARRDARGIVRHAG